MRISSAALLLLVLAGCGAKLPDKPAEAKASAHREAMAAAESAIECAPAGRVTLAFECTLDRVETQDGLYLTLRHPDGGFRRLLVTQDGRGVIAADGAETAEVTPIGADAIEVTLGGARYRLPATVRAR